MAVLGARPGADADGLVLELVRAIAAHAGRAAILWSERTDALDAGVVTTASGAGFLPEGLRGAAAECHLSRIAHLGAGAEAQAAAALFHDLGEVTHVVLDGRMLGAVKADLGVFVVGDGMGADVPAVRALRDCCNVEVNEPSVAVAEAILRALAHRR